MEATRGTPSSVLSDNGTNLKCAAPLIQKHIEKKKEIRWNYIAPGCPWKGGSYERLMKEIKKGLKYSHSHIRNLTEEQFRTVIKLIENALNRRPITKLSPERDDQPALRPIDFLHPEGPEYIDVPREIDDNQVDQDFVPAEERRKKKDDRAIDSLELNHVHQSMLNTLEKFWSRWSTEYLLQLRTLTNNQMKSCGITRAPVPGELVLIESKFLAREDWPIARLVRMKAPRGEVAPHNAVIRTRNLHKPVDHPDGFQEVTLPLSQLYPLEMDLEREMFKTREDFTDGGDSNAALEMESTESRSQ